MHSTHTQKVKTKKKTSKGTNKQKKLKKDTKEMFIMQRMNKNHKIANKDNTVRCLCCECVCACFSLGKYVDFGFQLYAFVFELVVCMLQAVLFFC